MSTSLITETTTNVIEWASTETDEAKLLNQLRVCLSLTVENIRNAAFIVRRLEELDGFDGPTILEREVPHTVLRALRQIAYGKMLPETFLRLNGPVQRAVGTLSLEVQQSLFNGEKVAVVQPMGKPLWIPVDQLTATQATQVIAKGRLLDEQSQKRALDREAAFLPAKTAVSSSRGELRNEDMEARKRAIRAENPPPCHNDSQTTGDNSLVEIVSHANALLAILKNPSLPKLDEDELAILNSLSKQIFVLHKSRR